MGKIAMKKISVIIAAVLLIFATYFAVRIFAGYNSGYQYEVMDWNQDGRISITEIIESGDVGSRTKLVDGVECVEYFAYKDGLPIKVVCPDKE